jgi:hypothetical protein
MECRGVVPVDIFPQATSITLVSFFLVRAPVVMDEVIMGDRALGMFFHLRACTIWRSMSWKVLLDDAAFLKCFRDGYIDKSGLAVKK